MPPSAGEPALSPALRDARADALYRKRETQAVRGVYFGLRTRRTTGSVPLTMATLPQGKKVSPVDYQATRHFVVKSLFLFRKRGHRVAYAYREA